MITITDACGNVETMTEEEFRRRRGNPFANRTAMLGGAARRRQRMENLYDPLGDGVDALFDPRDVRQQIPGRG